MLRQLRFGGRRNPETMAGIVQGFGRKTPGPCVKAGQAARSA